MNEIPKLTSTTWDTSLIQINIDIENPKKELSESTKNKTSLWIANHPKKNYLVISEPIENIQRDVTVNAKIFMQKYNIDKSYIMKKINDQWTITESVTAISRNVSERINDYKEKVAEIFVGYYDI